MVRQVAVARRRSRALARSLTEVVGWVGLVAVVVVGGIGCSRAPTPVPSPSPTVSVGPTTESAEPTPPAKPERPEAMERDDAEGAAAAAAYFIHLYPYVMATADTAEYEAMSHQACGFCAGVIQDAHELRKREQTYVGGATVATLREAYLQDELTGVVPLDIRVTQAESRVLDSSGSLVSVAAAKSDEVRVEMALRDSNWVVVGIANLSEG